MTWQFRSKLTVLYSVLFLTVFIPTILTVRATVMSSVTNSIESELLASGAVFDSILALRGSQLEERASVLARDFGFRAAVATRDQTTIESALTNIANRLGGSHAMVLDLDGNIFASTNNSTGQVFVYDQMLGYDDVTMSRVGVLSDTPHLIVSAPIMSPVLTGWVIFALELNRSTARELEALSAVPLNAVILQQIRSQTSPEAHSPGQRVVRAETDQGPALSLVVELDVAEGSPPVSLVLSHSLALARRPYDRMLLAILGLGVLGIILLAGGSWWLAGRVTQPLKALTKAAERIKTGHHAGLDLDTSDEFGELAGAFNRMSDDILARESALRKTNKSLDSARRDAEAASRAKSDFLTVMSHELRTPMNGVLGLTEVILMSDVSDDTRDYLETIHESGTTLLHILNDILDLSKIESGKIELEEVSFDIIQLVSSLAESIRPQVEQDGLKLSVEFPNDLTSPMLKSDPTRVRQILANLLNNAKKFTHKGFIAINLDQTQLENGRIETRIEVKDTGIGITEQQIDRIFEGFHQADMSISRKYGGTGLGLSISRQLAELLEGKVGVDSSLGQGSTFWFTINCEAGVKAIFDEPEQLHRQGGRDV